MHVFTPSGLLQLIITYHNYYYASDTTTKTDRFH